MSEKANILLISPSPEIKEAITSHLTSNGFNIIPLSTIIEAYNTISKIKFDLMICDTSVEEITDLRHRVKGYNPQTLMILLADESDTETVMKHLSIEIDGCLFKPLRGAEVRFEINRLLSSRRKLNSNEKEVENKYIFHQSRNPQMAALYQASVEKIAKSDATILIQGESGTGKELMAYWIYTNSLRKTKPFVKVSCAVLPEGVLESELFGHERGSFTGAYSKRKGRFELADSGTIFLDEIGEISPAIQSKFLRVLQEKEFQRIGSNATIKVDVRVIAATSRDLKKEVARGHFREDLYYRLNVISLNIPPLRERKEDIPFLAEMFMKKYALRSQRILEGFENQALKLLTAYDWPGNVRELENAIERAVVLSTHNIITIGDLPNNIIQLLSEEPNEDLTLREAREKFEEEYIKNVLFRFKGNITQTARYLGLARKNLQEKVRKYNINAEEFR